MTLARVQWLSGRRSPARSTIDRAVELAPRWAEANAVRAVLYLDEARRGPRTSPELLLFDEAEASAARAVDLDPAWPNARVILGQVHLADDDGERAGQMARATLDLDPDHPGGRVLLGDVLAAAGDHDGATGHYIMARPDPTALDRLRSPRSEPWPTSSWGPALLALGVGSVLRLADASDRLQIGASLIVVAIMAAILARLANRVREDREVRQRDIRRLLGSEGDVAARTRPAASARQSRGAGDQLPGSR